MNERPSASPAAVYILGKAIQEMAPHRSQIIRRIVVLNGDHHAVSLPAQDHLALG